MIVTLTGSNVRAVNTELHKILADFRQEHGDSVERFDVSELVDFDGILDAVRSISLLDPKKLVIIRDFGQSKPFLGVLENIIQSTADSTDVILVDPRADKRSSVVKGLKKSTDYREFSAHKPQELTRWVIDEVTQLGGSISSTDAMYLTERIGNNEMQIENELKKLVGYQAVVDRASIDLLTDPTPQSKVFDMLDSLFRRDLKRAWSLYEDQRSQGEEPQKLMAMITWQLQQIALAVFAPHKDVATLTNAGMSPYAAQKSLAIARHISPNEVKTLIDRLATIDNQVKTSADIDAALSVYFAEVTGGS